MVAASDISSDIVSQKSGNGGKRLRRIAKPTSR
jgi:hypothetical protein